MKQSESIASLAAALVAVQKEIKTIGYDSDNLFFNSKYTSLTAILEFVRPILAKHDLAVVQGASTPHTDTAGAVTALSVEAILIHSSGEWLSIAVVMPITPSPIAKGSDVRMPTAQGAGAAITYGRRYALSALLSLATDEDDDGNSTRPAPSQPKPDRVKAEAAGWDGSLAGAASYKFPFRKHKLTDVPLGEIAREDLQNIRNALVKQNKPQYADLLNRVDAVLADHAAQGGA